MKHLTSLRTIAIVVSVALAVAACGSGESVGDTGEAVKTEVVTSQTNSETATAVPSATDPTVTDSTAMDSATDPTVPDPGVPDGPRIVEHQYGSTSVPADPQRIVALSEEFLLADLLSVGVVPIASTSNDAASFVGLDPTDTEDIEIIASAEFNLERLAALSPDLLVAYPDYIDLVGYDLLAAIAPTVAIGTADSDWRERLALTGAAFGVETAAQDQIERVEQELATAREVLDGVSMSVASISPGPFIRAYTDERTVLTEIMTELGVAFVPNGGDTDDNGRIEISLERLGDLDGDVLVLLQATFIEGVDAAVESVQASPLWATLPAVRADAVITLDQLAYPGADGVGRFAADLASAIAATR